MNQILRCFLQGLAVIAACSFSGFAFAQRSVADKAAAEALFDEALELMKAEKYGEACPKLEESQRIDAGIGTLLYLAECYEKSGRTASAWATFREAASAASAAGQGERARQGKARADRLEPNLSKLTIMVASETKAIEGLQVTRGGEAVQAPLFDSAVPVDPGSVVIEASAPGYESFSKTVTVAPNGGRAVLEVPPLVAQPNANLPGGPATPTGEGDTTSSGTPNTQGDVTADSTTIVDGGSSTATAGVILLGVGAAGLVVGSIFGVQAMNQDDDADAVCGKKTCDTKAGAEAADDARQSATISTIAFIAGGGAILTGAILYALAPDSSQAAQLHLSPTTGGAYLGYSGRF